MDARDASGVPSSVRSRGRRARRTSQSERPLPRIAKAAPRTSSSATSSRAATASTASAATQFRPRVLKTHERVYPFGWLGVLADVPPVSPELIYLEPRARLRALQHALGGAQPLLRAMRSRHRARRLERRALLGRARGAPARRARGAASREGRRSRRASRRCAASSRSRLRYGRLFLAGDAAHIVPPTGAKGLNLAVRDVHQLAAAFVTHYSRETRRHCSMATRPPHCVEFGGRNDFPLGSRRCCIAFPGRTSFDRGMQIAELDQLVSSAAARAAFVEAYTGS